MAILSNVSGYTNIGNDLQIILTGTGMPAVIPNVMSVEWKQLAIDINRTQMNNVPMYAQIPNGYEGTIDFHRGDGSFELAMVALQNNWQAGGDYQFNTLTCIVSNTGANTFTFTGVAIKMEKGGDWKGDEVTKCRLQFKAAQMQ
jgi:hypothetical protein